MGPILTRISRRLPWLQATTRIQPRTKSLFLGKQGAGSVGLRGVLAGFWKGLTQRAQYPLIKEYSLSHNMNPL